jgi:hypothetical protein
MTSFVNVGGGDNWDVSFAGGGPLDSVSQVVKSIQGNDGFSMVANGAVVGLDLLDTLQSPLEAIAGSAIGWLLEHVVYLDWFLDRTAGDPVAVEATVTALQNAAKELDKLAGEHIDALSQVPTYAEGDSGSFNAFFGTVMPRAEDIKARSMACIGQSECMMLAAAAVAATRGIIRDTLTELAVWLIELAVKAIAAAPYTEGASVAWAIYDGSRRAARTAIDLSKELKELAQKLVKVAEEMGKLKQAVLILAKNAYPAMAKTADMSAKAPEYHQSDEAKARREPPEPPPSTTPNFPWRVQGTLDE